VVALHEQRALRRKLHGLLHHVARIGPVAHEIAEQRKALGTLRARVRLTGIESLAVRVQVGQKSEFHGGAGKAPW